MQDVIQQGLSDVVETVLEELAAEFESELESKSEDLSTESFTVGTVIAEVLEETLAELLAPEEETSEIGTPGVASSGMEDVREIGSESSRLRATRTGEGAEHQEKKNGPQLEDQRRLIIDPPYQQASYNDGAGSETRNAGGSNCLVGVPCSNGPPKSTEKFGGGNGLRE